ncbi:hypothetical protein ACLB2K_063152 [Fragaria x ananassa]
MGGTARPDATVNVSLIGTAVYDGDKICRFEARACGGDLGQFKVESNLVSGTCGVNFELDSCDVIEDSTGVFSVIEFIDDLAKGDAWKVVNLVHPRNIYRAATLREAEDEEEDVAYQEPNTIGIPNSSTVRLNNFKADRSVQIRDEEPRLVDVDPNQQTDEDSDDEERDILPEINYDTEEDSSDDSDYES